MTTRWDVARELWRSRIGGALRGLVALQLGATLGLFLLGLLHERALLTPQLPPGEHWSMFDCFYFATITITTVGFGETVSPTGSIASYPDVRAYTAIVLMLSMITTAPSGSSVQADGLNMRPVVSFVSTDGRLCREAQLDDDEMAARILVCRDVSENEWCIEAFARMPAIPGKGGYHTAGIPSDPVIDAAYARLGRKVILDQNGEKQAIKSGWVQK